MKASLILALLVFSSFGRALQYGFINFDDPGYVYENPIVSQGLTLEGVQWAFTHSHGGNWHPATSLSHMLDCQVFGLNPAGHHLVSLLLHYAAVLLLFSTLRKMTGFFWRSAVVAALFAIHPLRVESVVWISERKDVLSGLFFMLTLRAYVSYARRPFAVRRYFPVMISAALGLLTKPMLVTLPCILLLFDFWPLRRQGLLRIILEKVPLFVLSAVICLSTFLAQEHALTKIGVSFLWRVGNAIVSYTVYLQQLVWPFNLALVYPHPGDTLPLWKIGLSLLVLAGISAATCAGYKKRPWALAGWLWYLGMLVPAIGLVQVGVQAHADRYTYLAHIGIYILIVWAVAERIKYRRLLVAATILILSTFTLITRTQTAHWRNSIELWSHTLACTENNATALTNLGSAFFEKGEVNAAKECFFRALDIDPREEMALYNLGFSLVHQGALNEGISYLRNVIQLNPEHAKAWKALGATLILQGQLQEGILASLRALDLSPEDAEILGNLKIANARLMKEPKE